MTSPAHTPGSPSPSPWLRLVDDASALDPAGPDADLAPLVEAYDARPAADRDVVGALVVPEHRLPDVPPDGPPVRVVAAGGAGAVAGIARLASRRGVTLAALDVALRDVDDLAGNARRVALAVDQARSAGDLDEDVRVHVELPATEPSYGWLAGADVVAESEMALKFRLGPDVVASPEALAGWIDAALDRETPFAFSPGLDRAVRRLGPASSAYGFVNVALATLALWDGEGSATATDLVAETDRSVLMTRLTGAADDLPRARRWFTSFASYAPDRVLAEIAGLDA